MEVKITMNSGKVHYANDLESMEEWGKVMILQVCFITKRSNTLINCKLIESIQEQKPEVWEK